MPEPAEIILGHCLTLADKTAERETEGLGGSGQGDLIRALAKTPAARAELSSYKRRDIDTSHLSRYDGTDYCQWFGRRSDGFFHPIGRIMLIVTVDTGPSAGSLPASG